MNSAAEVLAKQTELANAERHLDELLFGDVSGFPMAGNPAESDAKKKVAALRDEVAIMQSLVGGKVFLIPEYNVSILAEKLDKLNKRAAKLGVEPVGFTPHETVEKNLGTKNKPEWVVFQHVAVRGTSPKLAGWQFAATLEHDENGVIVRRLPALAESVNLHAFRTADPTNCDQCHQRRRRTDTYVVYHVTSGALKQVGSSCLKDFLGGQSPERIASWLTFVADLLDDLEDSESEFYGGSAPARESTLFYMTHVACMIRTNGWTSRGQAYDFGGYATADAAADNIFNQAKQTTYKGVRQWVDPTEADARTASDAIEFVRALDESELESDYVYNLFTSLKGESVAKRQYGIAASAIKFHGKAIETKIKSEKRAESNYIGTVGQKKFSVDVTITKIVSIEDRYSYNGGTKPLYCMIDANGNVVQWFASSWIDGMDVGVEGTIVGTIKAHDDGTGKYNDKNYGKSTQLTRCKFTPKEA